MKSFYIDEIPLDIHSEHMVYCDKTIPITSVKMNEPFKLTFCTEHGEFIITKMSQTMCGVQVPGNKIEKFAGKSGYDILISKSFDSLLEVVF